MTRKTTALLGLVALGVASCARETPTSLDESLLPDEPTTVEVVSAWEDFGSNLQVLGGFGSPVDLGRGILANKFAGTLDARTLIVLDTFPSTASVRDTTGTTRPDSMLTYVSARLVAVFDTISSTNTGPVTLAVGLLEQDFDPATAGWDHAVDTINDARPWTEPGAGPSALLATAEWDPAAGDSTWFDLDSAALAVWADREDASGPAIRLDVVSAGERLEVTGLVLRIDARPSVNPDTLIELTGRQKATTFIYNPNPQPSADGVRIGGTPAWRTVMDVTVPLQLNGPQSLCDAVGCPVTLTPDRLNYAGLILHSRTSEEAFQPTDTVGLDVRAVLAPDALPKSPLGNSLVGTLGRRVAPASFGEAPGEEIEIPITGYARDQLRGETQSGGTPATTLALLSVFEPVSIAFASFFGPGSTQAPALKLVVTAGKTVELP